MEKWLKWAIEIQSLSQIGLTYTKDVYDRERYQRLREISAEMLAKKTEVSIEKVKDLFCHETGYQTPKLDTRAAIFRNNKILDYYQLTKEEAMAFGDGNNDIEMLEAVGRGVAMKNASLELKSIADDICDDVANDGIY